MSLPILEISRSGMDVEYRRVELVANNIANSNSASASEADAYFPMRLLSGPRGASKVSAPTTTPASASVTPATLLGVQIYGYEPANVKPRQVFEPAHPQANEQGFVTYPGMDQVDEMTTMMRALRSYEANVAVFNATRSMYLRAFELGGRQ